MVKKKLVYYIIFLVVVLVGMRLLLFKYADFDTLLKVISGFYVSYGAVFLFIAGLLEAIVLLGLYVPGSSVILIGATLAGAKVIGLPSVVIWSTLGMVAGYCVSYSLGLLGWDKIIANLGFDQGLIEKARRRAKESRWIYVWSTFHPNFGAVASLALGIIRTNFWQFLGLMIPCQLFWSIFWGIVFYYFGMILFEKIALVVGIFVILAIIFETFHLIREKRSKIEAV